MTKFNITILTPKILNIALNLKNTSLLYYHWSNITHAQGLWGVEGSGVRGHVGLQGPQPQLQSELGPGTDPLQVRTAGGSPVDKHGGGEGGVTQRPVAGDLGHTRDTAGGQRSTPGQN